MKIIIVNRNFFITGGPEKYMFTLMENMPQHQFIPFCVAWDQNRETPYRRYFVDPPGGQSNVYFSDFKMSASQKLVYAANSIYHQEARRKLEQLIIDERPDLVLCLNAVYFSDSIIDACRYHNVPVIWRLSDFNKVCANYLLYRDGQVCEDCLDLGLISAVRNRCGGYQRSLAAALTKAAGMWLTRVRGLHDHVDFFVAPSAFTREKMIQGGFAPEKVVHIPTMAKMPDGAPMPMSEALEILYVGRLSHEKGVDTLLAAFALLKNPDVRLSLVGDDTSLYAKQLKASVPDAQRNRVRFHGFLQPEQVHELYARSFCFVVPSVWHENQPNTVLEGMSHAKPAIVSDRGSLREMVENGETGHHFEASNPAALAAKLDVVLSDPEMAREMGLRARAYVLRVHSLQKHLSALEALFQQCIDRKKSETRWRGTFADKSRRIEA